jgi:GAF domain-containing protein
VAIEVPLQTGSDRRLRAVLANGGLHGRELTSNVEVALRALTAEAVLGSARLADRLAVEAAVRRQELARSLSERMATADDPFGACRLAAQAAADEAGARWADAVLPAGDSHFFPIRGDRHGDDEQLERSLALAQGKLLLGFAGAPAPLQVAAAEAVAEALGRSLAELGWRRAAAERRTRQAAIAAAAASSPRAGDDTVSSILEIALEALHGDVAVVYALRDGAPVPVKAAGGALPQRPDGIAAQALAAARVVVDADGAFLADAPLEGMVAGLAAPLPGRSERGAISLLFRERPQLTSEDGDDLRAFAQLAAAAIDRSVLELELDRRERLRAGFVQIAEALSGTREPTETYAAVAGAARRALGAGGAVVVIGDDLVVAGAAPARPSLVDESGHAGALLQLAAREGRVVLSPEATKDRRVPAAERRRMSEAGHRSALCVPVEADGSRSVIGVVWPEPHGATDDDLELARHVATAAGAAIERAEVLAAERRARARAQELQRIGGLMASNLDAPAVLREIVSQAALLLDADS